MNKRLEIDNNYLVYEIIKGRSIRDLAKQFECSPACIYKRIKNEYNGNQEILETALKKNRDNSNNKRWNK